jgi:putative DNA modification/repair radical SAM protein
MDVRRKLAVLADAAKYDASCAGSVRSGTAPEADLGIYRSIGVDGRPLALLKILLSNECIYDCHYCVHRRSSDVERASFSPGEVIALTLDYHRRGLIDGLFLSSGVSQSPDDTMEQLVDVARTLRRDHHYFGYIHLKTIPDASGELVAEAGRWADRLSVNVEMPRQRDLDRVAPEKSLVQITSAMGSIRDRIEESVAEQKRSPRAPRFAPSGQTTQMVIGATDATDADILFSSSSLYARQRLRRIYYSAYVPIPDAPGDLPEQAPPALRERRLYQADWLMREYGFSAGDLTPPGAENLDLSMDPKLGWALRNRDRFPVDVNRATKSQLLRVPGFGHRTVEKILVARRDTRLTLGDLIRLRAVLETSLPFIVAADHIPRLVDRQTLELKTPPSSSRQLDLFPAFSAAAGE